jgi:hypothetical protein
MTDAKRKDKAPDDEQPNLGQEEAEGERLGKDKMEHMGDRSSREREKSPRPPQPSERTKR